MKIGVQVRATAKTVDLRWLAMELEAAGIESLFLPEHTHVPVGLRSRHPGGSDLMEPAKRGLDPWIGLAAVAGVTTRLRLGTGVCLLPQHDPIVLAKQIATLDVLSGGRVIAGFGAGWNREEMANHGVDPPRRWEMLREHVEAMTAIWSSDEASYEGQFVRFGPIWQWPKPVQRPRPPVLIGGEGPGVLDRVLAYGDGWLPNDHPELPDRVTELRRRAAELGRPEPSVNVYAMPWDRGVLAHYGELGVERCAFNLPVRTVEEASRALERLSELIASAGETVSAGDGDNP